MSEPTTSVKSALFLSSYAPLWSIFIWNILYVSKFNPFGKIMTELEFFAFIVLLVAPIIVLLIFLRKVENGTNSNTYTIKDKVDSTSEYLEYIVVYVIPLITQNYEDLNNMITLAVIIFMIGFVYIRANLFHINPILNVIQYKMYKIEDENENEFVLLTKNKIRRNMKIKANSLSSNILVENHRTNIIDID